MDYEALEALAREAGFTHAAPLNPGTLELKPEVRQMCEANTCGAYNSRWSCPPGCGELEELRAEVAKCRSGILVQTVGQLEDTMDWEGMMEAEALHKERFLAMFDRLRRQGIQTMAMGTGGCRRCAACTYPDAPCRFPDKMVSSMEAHGIVVSDACKANGLPYYYGPNTIAYTSCFLFK